MYVQFVNEVLKSLCIEQDKSTCADKFVNGLLKNSAVNDSDIRQVMNGKSR